MLDKRMTPAEIVAGLSDGMTIGIGGWGPRRKPMALVREILRSPLKDLTIVAFGGPDVGLLCAAGKVKKLIFAFVSLDAIPLEPYFRKAREAGTLEIQEMDEGMLQWGLKAAAMQLPFLPTRVGLGTDLMNYGGFKTVKSPYDDGEVLLAMPAIPLDVALLHVSRADRLGNIQALGPDSYYDEWYARAAKECYVSAEEVVDRLDHSYPEDAKANIVERCFISGVTEIRLGAHPTSMPPSYGWNMAHLKAYSASASEEGGWERYFAENIAGGEAAHIENAGGADKIASLPLPIF